MSEDWGDLESGGRKGGRNWLGWGCGLGCLGLLILGAVGAYGLKGFAEDFLNPTSARGRLGELMALEPAPGESEANGWALRGGSKLPFVDLYAFVFEGLEGEEVAGLKAALIVVDGELPEDEFRGPGDGTESFELEYRGVVLEAWRTDDVAPDASSTGLGVLLPTDLPERQILLVLDRQDGSEGEAPTEDQLRSLLGWFDIWPDAPPPAKALPPSDAAPAGVDAATSSEEDAVLEDVTGEVAEDAPEGTDGAQPQEPAPSAGDGEDA
jgi:hypothetical protein